MPLSKSKMLLSQSDFFSDDEDGESIEGDWNYVRNGAVPG